MRPVGNNGVQGDFFQRSRQQIISTQRSQAHAQKRTEVCRVEAFKGSNNGLESNQPHQWSFDKAKSRRGDLTISVHKRPRVKSTIEEPTDSEIEISNESCTKKEVLKISKSEPESSQLYPWCFDRIEDRIEDKKNGRRGTVIGPNPTDYKRPRAHSTIGKSYVDMGETYIDSDEIEIPSEEDSSYFTISEGSEGDCASSGTEINSTGVQSVEDHFLN